MEVIIIMSLTWRKKNGIFIVREDFINDSISNAARAKEEDYSLQGDKKRKAADAEEKAETKKEEEEEEEEEVKPKGTQAQCGLKRAKKTTR